MSEFEPKYDDTDIICPYCGHSWQPEGCDFPNEDEREDECGRCGNKYTAYATFSVTYHTRPDCTMNGEQHKYTDFRSFKRCETCGDFKRVRDEYSVSVASQDEIVTGMESGIPIQVANEKEGKDNGD